MKMQKRVFSFFLALTMILGSLGVSNFTVKAEEEQTAAELAHGKTVTVSSVENAMPQNVGANVVDGNSETRWSSEKMKETGATDESAQTAQWLTIDLGIDEADVSQIRVDFYLKVWATKYQIQTADTNTNDTQWTTIASKDRSSDASSGISDTFGAEDFSSTTLKRYVRFYFEKVNVNAAGTGVSVKEISITGTPKEKEPTNVALGKTVTVSSVEAAVPGNIGANVVDGNSETRWSCEAMKSSGATDETPQTPQWLIIDLGAQATKVTEIKIDFFKKVWATKYQIQTSDTNEENGEWETVEEIERTSGTLQDDHSDTFNAENLSNATLKRYVRFYFEKVNVQAGGTGVSVKEITIMGTQDGIIPPEGGGEEGGEGEETEPTYSRDFTDGNIEGMEILYGSGANITAAANNAGLSIAYGNTRAGVVDKQMTPVADAIFEATIVPQQNSPRFGLIMRATDENHKIYVGTENNNNQWFWEYWGDGGQKWSGKSAGPALTAGQEAKIKVQLVGQSVTLWVNGTQVLTAAMGNSAHMGAGYFGFDKSNGAGTFIVKSMKLTEVESASGIIHSIASLPEIGADDTAVTLPQVKEGYTIRVVGSSKEQIISNDGTILSHNIGDREVALLVEVTNDEDETDTARRNFSVTVPSKNGNYPEGTFPAVNAPNEKPVVIPALQEWYGTEGQFTLSKDSKIVINDAAGVGLSDVAENMKADLKEITGLNLAVENGATAGPNDIYIESLSSDTYETGSEGYFMTVGENGVKIYAPTYTGCLYGTITAEQILWQDEEHKNIPNGVIRDYPDYEIRGMMFDVGRIPHRIQYLKDYTKIMTWYKMNEFHLHLNDDFNYNPNALPNHWEPWTGMHRLENDTYPSLTKKQVYPNNDYFNEDYADPIYTKEEYKALETLANSRGIDLIAEFDTPSHSTAYSEYATENPDNIDWLGKPINSKNSGNGQMLALDTNSADPEEKERALRARKFIEGLYADYLAGDDPTFKSDTVHVGADEYWDKSKPEAFRDYTNFLADLMESYGKTARMWGAQKMFPGNTPIDPENIVLDVWATYEEDPIARMEEGFRVVNVPQPFLYTTPGRDHKDMVVEENLFKKWDPTIFNSDDGTIAFQGEPLLLGAKAALWGDEFREGITEADTHERMLRAAAITAQKTWGGQEADDSYIEYQMAFEDLQEGPGTEIAHHIDSVSDVVTDYDLSETEKTDDGIVIKDQSGNGYDALVKNGEIKTVDGKKMVKFSGETLMTTPLKTLDYPYTISFDVKAEAGNTDQSMLFNGYDGQLRAADMNGKMTIKRSFYTQDTTYALPTDKVSTVTIVGNFQNTKVYVDGTLVKMLHMDADGNRNNIPDDQFWSTFVFPMEEIGENFHGYIGNIKTWNKALPPERFSSEEEPAEINVALNEESYAERFGGSPGLNTGDLKRHPAWKATDGDKEDPNSYWNSSNSDNDYLMTDLGEVRNVSKVTVTWKEGFHAADFAIEVSTDGETWERVKEINGNTASENVITLDAPKEAQFVKVQGIKRSANVYRLTELEVFEKVEQCQHSNTEVTNAKDATCTVDGYTGDTVCTDCGATVKKGEVIKAEGHSYGDWVIVKEPTEKEEGLREKTCSVCGDKIQETIGTIPVCEHEDLNVTGAKDATCTVDGYTGDTVCKDCGKTIKKGETIKAKGHIYGDWKTVKEPTESEEGLREKICSACGLKLQEAIEKLPAKPDSENPSTPPADSGNSNSGNNGGSTPTSGNNSAATGDTANILGLLAIALCSVGCIYEIRRRKINAK